MTTSKQEKNGGGNPLFPQLLMMLSTSALQHLGQAPGPGGESPAVDLRSAEYMIDLLEMLEKKTAGNLEAEEQRMLTEILAAVRLAFVRATEKSGAAPEPEPDGAQAADEPLVTPEGKDRETKPPAEEKGEEPRFHKSYG